MSSISTLIVHTCSFHIEITDSNNIFIFLQLIRQQVSLIATEGVTLKFEEEAIREIARMGALINRTVENIGARRLHTVIERVMENLSFEAAEMEEKELVVDKKLVQDRLSDVLVTSDLSRYIL